MATLWEHFDHNSMSLGALVIEHRLAKKVSKIFPIGMYGSQISFGPGNFLGNFFRIL